MIEIAHSIDRFALCLVAIVLIQSAYRVARWFFICAAIRALARIVQPNSKPEIRGNGEQAPAAATPPPGASSR